MDRHPAATRDRHSGTGRAAWLKERLAELARNLGRAPNTKELRSFILRYRIDPAEIDALVGEEGASPSTKKASSVPGLGLFSIPESRKSTEITTSKPGSSHIDTRTTGPLPPASHPELDNLPVLVDRKSDRVIRRAVDDLVDDWFRAGRDLRYEDVTRLTTKRGLSAEQVAVIVKELDDQGVEVVGLRTERRVDDDLDDEELESGRQSTAGMSDLVSAYLFKISKYPLIWAEDEVRLGRQIRLGLDADEVLGDEERRISLSPAVFANLREASAAGRRAHSKMVCANLRLVVSIAKHRSFNGCGVELIDRIQDGNAGLMHAADKFDPTLGYKFSTYATWWIRQAISRGIGDRGRLIRLPVHVHEKLSQLRRTRRELVGRLDRDPTTTELAEALEWPAETVQALLDCSRPVASLDVLVGTEGDTTLGDLLSDLADIDGRTDPVNCVIESSIARDLDRVLNGLPERSAEVVRRRFGLRGAPEQTLDEIGQHFGVTRERIRQIEAKAMDRLRQPYNRYWLLCYMTEDYPEQPPIPPEREARGRSELSPGWSSALALPEAHGGAETVMGTVLDRQQFLTGTVSDVVDAS